MTVAFFAPCTNIRTYLLTDSDIVPHIIIPRYEQAVFSDWCWCWCSCWCGWCVSVGGWRLLRWVEQKHVGLVIVSWLWRRWTSNVLAVQLKHLWRQSEMMSVCTQ